MNNQWITKALGQKILAAGNDDAALDEKTVVLMNGKNAFGDRIYAYIELTLRTYKKMLEDNRAGNTVTISDYGTVIAAGKGNPPDDLVSEMAVRYNLVDYIPKPAAPPANISQPKVWGEPDDGE